MRRLGGVIPEAPGRGAAGCRHVCGVISPCSANRANKVTPIWSSRQTPGLHPLIVRRWVKEGMIAAVQVGRESRIPITEAERQPGQERAGLLVLYGRGRVMTPKNPPQAAVISIQADRRVCPWL